MYIYILYNYCLFCFAMLFMLIDAYNYNFFSVPETITALYGLTSDGVNQKYITYNICRL